MSTSFTTKIRHGLAATLVAILGATGVAYGQDGNGVVSNTDGQNALQTTAQVQAYWTSERMAAATPMEPRTVLSSSNDRVLSPAQVLADDDQPTIIPGWNPGSGLPQPSAEAITLEREEASTGKSSNSLQAYAYNDPPDHPLDYYDYGKFQRWTWYGRYTTFPTSTIGKLFFSQGGGNYVCSATVVNRDMIATAGHCVSDGAGNWSSNVLFCPSYNAAGVNPTRGCWTVGPMTTTSDWHTQSDIDRDYACGVTSTFGTIINDQLGDVTGWLNMAFNYGADELVFSTGYPAGWPFVGNVIIFTAAAEWYNLDRDPSDSFATSKYIGNDMTGGSSGGGWLLNLEHNNNTYVVPPVDSNNGTDPRAVSNNIPSWHGLNSHRRCLSTCSGSPSTTSGPFINEMGSPVMRNSSSDNGDMYDIVQACISNGGN